jgi:hypothetical protein
LICKCSRGDFLSPYLILDIGVLIIGTAILIPVKISRFSGMSLAIASTPINNLIRNTPRTANKVIKVHNKN